MSFAAEKFSRSQVDDAGKALIAHRPGESEWNEAVEVIGRWRSCHRYPLHIVGERLREFTFSTDRSATTAQRMKRLQSIELKLRQRDSMRLSQMQDIGGCRAIVQTADDVDVLVNFWINSKLGSYISVAEPRDYIKNPKSDGYRGVHLIATFKSPEHPPFDGLKNEIQIRSKLQHAWATALEICESFTHQAFKPRIKTAKAKWLRFFALMASQFAEMENRPLVPDTPKSEKDRVAELKQIEDEERISYLIGTWTFATRLPSTSLSTDPEAYLYLLELNAEDHELIVSSYRKNEIEVAEQAYLDREKQAEPGTQAVLVSVDSFQALRRTYQNYYVDASVFQGHVGKMIGQV